MGSCSVCISLIQFGVTPMADSRPTDAYFYEIVVFTGQRRDAGTKSKVNSLVLLSKSTILVGESRFILSCPARTMKRVFDTLLILTERSFNVKASMLLPWRCPSLSLSFNNAEETVIRTCRSVGRLNYLHLWHDDLGSDRSAFWFLKSLAVRDLKTMKTFHFIAQRWFAVEEDHGKVHLSVSHCMSIRPSRLNVFCPSPVTRNESCSLLFYRKKSMSIWRIISFGIRSSLVQVPIASPGFNVVLRVLFFSLSGCF